MAGPRGSGRTVAPTCPHAVWAGLALDAPEGLAVLDEQGRFLHINRAGLELCGSTEAELIGTPAPFTVAARREAEPLGLLEDDSTEHITTWSPAPGIHREFAYHLQRLQVDPSLTAVAFRDVANERHRQRRLAAIASTATNLSSQVSLTAILDALASEVLQADALAAVQILTRDRSDGRLHIMGSAGFRRWPDFFDRLLEVSERGGTFRMLDALRTGEPVVVHNRWEAVRTDPAWAPLHDYHSVLPWESFASVPLLVRGRAAGVLNAFFAPGQVVSQRTIEFLTAMAEQAAIAVDYANLMQRERDVARRDERQRLARDLHDSIVQQVFSITMQAKSMEVLGERTDSVPSETVRRIASEVSLLARTVLADLRAMVHELRPAPSAELGGLEEAIRALVDSTTNRTGLRFSLAFSRGLEQLNGEMAEDVYRIVAEAIHNVVKHAEANKVAIRLILRGGRLHATVTDDGCGIEEANQRAGKPGPAAGYGLSTMKERAERWGGTLTVRPRQQSGTIVRLAVPLAYGNPLATNGSPTGGAANPHSLPHTAKGTR